jgi:chromosome segregation ATPase
MASASSAKLQAALSAVNAAVQNVQNATTKLQEKHHTKLVELESLIGESNAEGDFLRGDNTRLSNQLQELQQDYLDLQEAASTTVERLDTSVRQLDLILEH